MTNSTLLTAALAAPDLDLLEFQSVLLFVSRVAFDLLVTQILFAHPWAEVCVVCTAAFMVVCSSAWGFGTALTGFMLVKTLTIFVGRIFMIIVRISNLYLPNGISRQKQDWIGYVLGVLLALNMLEAGYAQAKQGYPGGLFISIALGIPWFVLPRPHTFLIRPPNHPSSYYFFGTSWPWIIAYTLWNIAFTIMQERGEPNMTWDTVLANAAALIADFINCIRIHPGVWIHSRANTLMWTAVLGVANQNRPMVSNVLVDKRVENPAAYIVDAGIGVISVAFIVVHVWCLFRPVPIAAKNWLFGKIPGSVFAGFVPVDDDVTQHLLQATIAPVCGCNSHLEYEIRHGKGKVSATVVGNPANGEHVPSPTPQALNDDGTPKAP